VYTSHLRIVDSQGALDMDTATWRCSQVCSLTAELPRPGPQAAEGRPVRRLAGLLDVLDSDLKVQRIQAHSDLSVLLMFYLQSRPPPTVLGAADVAQALHRQLSQEKPSCLLFKVLRVDTAGCLLECSGHGHCDPITKRCICSQLWMENLIQHYVRDGRATVSGMYSTCQGWLVLSWCWREL
uniref:KIAA0319-like C-terminal domain-containing protein n=1 Tax=Sciurus vulgaris TaxID=55149 RepID=A0A8D2CVG0_SCIVU